jgi:3-phenylpropionate/trans-cinnamate dioxygenase ferredoxin reductase subunit
MTQAAGAVIVGAGQAGSEAAIRLRQAGYAHLITLLGAEPHAPYHRPPLSKAYLAGEADAETLPIRAPAAYARADIDLRPATLVEAIDRPTRQVRLAGGAVLAYRHLVLATGGRARRLSCPGADLAPVLTLRALDDVAAIRAQMRPGTRMVIVGGGYVGLEVAATAVKHGLEVDLVEAAPRLLARVAGPDLSAFYAQAHREAGVRLHLGATLAAIHARPGAPGAVGGVALGDGSVIAADVVLAGIGLVPNTELAERAGLAVADGIVTDAYCRTEDEAIYAIGDCANHPSALLGTRIRLESVPNALEQGRVAADAIAGRPRPYDAVPWFWSDQYDLKLQSVGLIQGHDQMVVRGSLRDRAFVMFYLKEGRLMAADAVNRPGDFMAAKRLVTAQASPDPAKLADPATPLKTLI